MTLPLAPASSPARTPVSTRPCTACSNSIIERWHALQIALSGRSTSAALSGASAESMSATSRTSHASALYGSRSVHGPTKAMFTLPTDSSALGNPTSREAGAGGAGGNGSRHAGVRVRPPPPPPTPYSPSASSRNAARRSGGTSPTTTKHTPSGR